MIIDKAILDDLSTKAKASPRLRMSMDLRNSASDLSQKRCAEQQAYEDRLDETMKDVKGERECFSAE